MINSVQVQIMHLPQKYPQIFTQTRIKELMFSDSGRTAEILASGDFRVCRFRGRFSVSDDLFVFSAVYGVFLFKR
jgi:hypothetical protein